MDLYINAIAHYIPEARVPNSYFKDVNGLDDEWIFSRTGIKTRSKAGEGENTNTMALEAVARLKDKLPFAIEDTDLVVAATYSPHDTVATGGKMPECFLGLFVIHQRHRDRARVFRHGQGDESYRGRLRA